MPLDKFASRYRRSLLLASIPVGLFRLRQLRFQLRDFVAQLIFFLLAGRQLVTRDGIGKGRKGRVKGLKPQLDKVPVDAWDSLSCAAIRAVAAYTTSIVARITGPSTDSKQGAANRQDTEAGN